MTSKRAERAHLTCSGVVACGAPSRNISGQDLLELLLVFSYCLAVSTGGCVLRCRSLDGGNSKAIVVIEAEARRGDMVRKWDPQQLFGLGLSGCLSP